MSPVRFVSYLSGPNILKNLGTTGFEPATYCSQSSTSPQIQAFGTFWKVSERIGILSLSISLLVVAKNRKETDTIENLLPII
jgi:hypothetical protein